MFIDTSRRRAISGSSAYRLALTLLVARVLTNHSYDAFATYDLALLTNLFDRRSDFHLFVSDATES